MEIIIKKRTLKNCENIWFFTLHKFTVVTGSKGRKKKNNIKRGLVDKVDVMLETDGKARGQKVKEIYKFIF